MAVVPPLSAVTVTPGIGLTINDDLTGNGQHLHLGGEVVDQILRHRRHDFFSRLEIIAFFQELDGTSPIVGDLQLVLAIDIGR